MGQFVSKKSKRKVGLQPGYTPQLKKEMTDEAQIPMVQQDGSVKYASAEDFNWMIKMGLIEKPSQKS